MTRVSKPSIGADSHWSRPLPWGTPTLPAPTTVILESMGRKGRAAAERKQRLVMDGAFAAALVTRGNGRSPAPRVHLPPRVGAQLVDLIERAATGDAQALFRAAIGARRPSRGDQGAQVVI